MTREVEILSETAEEAARASAWYEMWVGIQCGSAFMPTSALQNAAADIEAVVAMNGDPH
jgi:hypothetical protein